jgi:hypothetical protein
MQVLAPRGLRTLLRTGQEIQRSVAAKPAGLLLHENLIWSLWPLHLGMRQYWRNLEALEQWTREDYHKGWWQSFVLDQGGTTFWHELYAMRGGIEGLYMAGNEVGLSSFAPIVPARGTMYSSRQRIGHAGATPDSIIREEEYETE